MDIIDEVVTLDDVCVSFDVNSPQKSFSGYTVYRLVLKVVKVPSFEVVKEEFLSWKRFSEFKKLHQNLKSSFPATFKEHLPEFAKGKIFGRFDDSVIEERRILSNKLLSIISNHIPMMRDPEFCSFIEHGRVMKSHNAPLGIDESDDALEQCNDQLDCQSLQEANEILHVQFDTTDGTSDTADGTSEITPMNNISPGNEEDVGGNDDVFTTSDTTNNNTDDSNQTFFREARSICGDDIEELASEAATDFPFTSPRTSTSHTIDSAVNTASLNSFRRNSDSNNNEDAPFANNNAVSCGSTLPQQFTVDERMSEKIEKVIEEDDYIYQASLAMSEANEQEEQGNNEAAFDLYKFGVGLLLRGVQTDSDKQRREAVRRKTAQYLLKAENLYKGQLDSSIDNKCILGESKWRFKLSDVKVFGIVDTVMLVQKVFTDDVYVMKVLHKQGGEYKKRHHVKKKPKSPRNLYNWRSVARLYNCVETSTGVYLLLEYITGGRLWDHLGLTILDMNLIRRHTSINESTQSWNPSDKAFSKVDNSFTGNVSHRKDGQTLVNSRTATRLKLSARPVTNDESNEASVCKWAAQIAYAIMEIHSKGIICRDLNPRNILMDSYGNVKLTYFSNVDGIHYPLNDDAVEMLYTSPEVNAVSEPTYASDWWSFGALLYELLMREPLYISHPDGITPRSVIALPKRISSHACSLLSGLLKYSPKERLGSGPSGNEEIKSHPFFNSIDWSSLHKAGNRSN